MGLINYVKFQKNTQRNVEFYPRCSASDASDKYHVQSIMFGVLPRVDCGDSAPVGPGTAASESGIVGKSVFASGSLFFEAEFS